MAETRDKRSDADLVGAVCAGETDAFTALVDRYLPDVYALVARMLHNTADAEDVTQEAFLRAFGRLPLCDVRRSFRSWLLKIAANVSLNHLRSRRRERALQLRRAERDGDAADRWEQTAEVPSPRDWEYWLSRLDESQRAAIVLFHFSEMSYTEVAEVLNVPLNTVKTLLHRGRRKLRELITRGVVPENGSWNVATQNG